MIARRRRRRSVAQQTAAMERARDLLQTVVTDIRSGHVATPEGIATVSSCIMTIAMLEREIGRRLTTPMYEITDPSRHAKDHGKG